MSRIRTIKPEFWTSEQVMECSPLARLLFIGMWNFCDDQGVHPASSKTLKAELFPSDDLTAADVSALLQELLDQQLIARFSDSGKDWLYVTGWQHQLIKNPSAPRYPAPPTSQQDQSTPALSQSYPSPTPALPQPYPSPTVGVPPVEEEEGKVKEGKVEETPQEERAATISPRASARTRAHEGGGGQKGKGAPMAADWFPTEAAYSVLTGLGIPRPFAEGCIPEFRLYWTERGDARAGWDASFVNSVKRTWDKRPRDSVKVMGQRRPGQTIAERITEEHALIFGDEPDPFSFLPTPKPTPPPDAAGRLIEGEVSHVH